MWKIKERKIIWKSEKKKVSLERGSFEMFGMKIEYMNDLEMEEKKVKRKRGFILKGLEYKEDMGLGIKN